MVEAHRRSSKHQRGLLHETESRQTFQNMLYQISQTNYFLFHFKPIGLFSNTVYEYVLHCTCQQKTLKSDRSK